MAAKSRARNKSNRAPRGEGGGGAAVKEERERRKPREGKVAFRPKLVASEHQFVDRDDPGAVAAFQHQLFLVDDVDLGPYFLARVCYAFQVGALEDAGDGIRELDLALFHQLVVFDDIDGRPWRDEGELVGLACLKVAILDLDDVLLAVLA